MKLSDEAKQSILIALVVASLSMALFSAVKCEEANRRAAFWFKQWEMNQP